MKDLLLPLAAVIVLGIGAQWLAWRLKAPSILLLLLVGFVAGPVTKLLNPDALFGDLLMPVVSLSVALILYEGGLTLRLRELKGVHLVLWSLVSVGAVVTWLLAAGAAWLLLGLSPALAVLIGAVFVVTGPTVILPLLREIRPRGQVGAILKWEGIVIDPIGAILAVLVFEVILIGLEDAAGHVSLAILKTIVVSGGIGAVSGLLLALLLRFFWIPDYLDNAVSLMFVIASYVAAEQVQHESGLLAATVMGVTLANQRFVDVHHIVEFKENLRVLLISSLFILLSARLQLDTITGLGFASLLYVAVLILIVRPLSVLISNGVSSWFGSSLDRRSVIFLSLVAPRGIVAAAVAAVFALRLSAAGFDDANALVPLTFMVIISTVAFCSLTAPLTALKLGVADHNPQGVLIVGAQAWTRAIAEELREHGFRVLLADTNRRNIAAARMAGVDTYAGSVLTEYALDEIDLGGIGRLIAATPNDWVNTLVVQRLARVFGRGGVYQIGSASDDEKHEKKSHRHLHGRRLFGPDVTFAMMASRGAQGADVKSTRLSEEFTFEQYRELHGSRATPMFLIRDEKRLMILSDEQSVDPKAGDMLIALVDPEDGVELDDHDRPAQN